MIPLRGVGEIRSRSRSRAFIRASPPTVSGCLVRAALRERPAGPHRTLDRHPDPRHRFRRAQRSACAPIPSDPSMWNAINWSAGDEPMTRTDPAAILPWPPRASLAGCPGERPSDFAYDDAVTFPSPPAMALGRPAAPAPCPARLDPPPAGPARPPPQLLVASGRAMPMRPPASNRGRRRYFTRDPDLPLVRGRALSGLRPAPGQITTIALELGEAPRRTGPIAAGDNRALDHRPDTEKAARAGGQNLASSSS